MSTLRVLIIEDSESDAALVVRQLEKADYSVIHERIETTDQLTAALEKQVWDVIVADYQLPEFDAPAALAELQRTGLDIPFIVVSGAIGEETAVSLMKSGACDYLMKGKLARLAPVVKRELSDVRVRQARKQTHEALRDSERNLQNSQGIAHIGHWITKPHTGETFWSDELYHIFGVNPVDFNGNLDDLWRNSVHPDDFERVMSVSGIANEYKRKRQIEYRILWPDGSSRYVLALAGQSIKDAQGNTIQRSGVVQDITERKLAEIALLEKMEESQKRAHELETITALSSSMRQAKTRPELVEVVLKNLVYLLSAQFATFAFLDGDTLLFEHAAGNLHTWRKRHIPIHTQIFDIVIQTRKPLTVNRPDAKFGSPLPDWMWENLSPECSLMIYPLIGGQHTVGVILLGFNHPGQLLPDQVNLVAAVAEIAGNALNRMLASKDLENMVERREKELEHIYQVASAASKSLDIREALQNALALTLAAVRSDMGEIYLLNEANGQPERMVYQGEGLENTEIFKQTSPNHIVQTVLGSKQTVIAPQTQPDHAAVPASDPSTNDSYVGLPMRIQDRVIGVLVIHKPGGKQVLSEEMTLLSFIANHLALVVENTRFHKNAEQSAVLEERSRLARELHDSVTQSLYSANLYSAGAQRYAAQGKYPEVDTYLSHIGQLVQQALKDMRLLVYELRASELVQNGLLGALQSRLDTVERRSAIHAEIKASGISSISEQVEENLYRIAIEALNNSLKHGRASHLSIELNQTDDQFELVIQDDGCGFDLASAAGMGGLGLTTMRERAGMIAGAFQIHTSPGAGTRIEVQIPMSVTPRIEEGEPE